jgi:hypothetical protein
LIDIIKAQCKASSDKVLKTFLEENKALPDSIRIEKTKIGNPLKGSNEEITMDTFE